MLFNLVLGGMHDLLFRLCWKSKDGKVFYITSQPIELVLYATIIFFKWLENLFYIFGFLIIK